MSASSRAWQREDWVGTQGDLSSCQCLLLGHRGGAPPGAVLGSVVGYGGRSGWNVSPQRVSGSPVLAACSLCPAVRWHPASLPSLRASLRPLAVPVSAISRGPKCESLHPHQIPTAALEPSRPSWISNWIAAPPLGVSEAQELKAGCPCCRGPRC